MSAVDVYRAPAAGLLEERHRWMTLLPEVAQLAHAIVNTNFVPKAYRGDEAAITAAILYGDEIGLSPMQALKYIAVIDGRPSIAAEAQRALILRAGHTIRPEDHSQTKFTWAGHRREDPEVVRFTWTLDDAKRAGLAGRDNWRKYPRAMLSARASADLARAIFADVIGGLAATEEIEDVIVADDNGAPTPAPALEEGEKKPARRRRAPRHLPVIPPPTIQAPPPDAPPPPPLPEDTPSNEGEKSEQAQPAPPAPQQPEAAPAKASQMQLNQMIAMFDMRGIRGRDERQAWVKQHTGITRGGGELTNQDAVTIIDTLAQQPIPTSDDDV